jgi:hypothetical protein
MREIKFRAWSKGKMWSDVHLMYRPSAKQRQEAEWAIKFKLGDSHDYVPKKNLKVMQYTGLKDAKGVEIYEGDILAPSEWEERGASPIVVEWGAIPSESNFQDGGTPLNFCVSGLVVNYPGNFPHWHPSKLEVIGNIYEHPALLEKQK